MLPPGLSSPSSSSTSIDIKSAWSSLNDMDDAGILQNGPPKHVLLVGGGLVGSLAAILFAQRGFKVTVAEKRPDPRSNVLEAGRSINLALSTRGIETLKMANLHDFILARCYPMRGRLIHKSDVFGLLKLEEQLYGLHGEAINSVDRKMLNIELIKKGQDAFNIEYLFNHECVEVNFEEPSVKFLRRGSSDQPVKITADFIVGADGAFSAVRQQLMKIIRMDYQQWYIPLGYKEILLPAGPDGVPLLSVNNLHIWPHHDYMMIALPNQDNSFTCTLFFPFELFEELSSSNDRLLQFFESKFPDFLKLIGERKLLEEYSSHSVGTLMSLKCSPFHYKDKCIMLGDAIHAMVPFYGQGMNCGFEDIRVLMQLLDSKGPSVPLSSIFAEFSATRKPQVDAICQLAVENYREMSSHVLSPIYKMKKKVTGWLSKVMEATFTPQYTMVSFSNIPYDQVIVRRDLQSKILLNGSILLAVGSLASILGLKYLGGR